MEPLNDDELNELLRQWTAPSAPAQLKPRTRIRGAWWWLVSGTIRVPVPVGIIAMIILALSVYWAVASRRAVEKPGTTVTLTDFQPVKQLQPRSQERRLGSIILVGALCGIALGQNAPQNETQSETQNETLMRCYATVPGAEVSFRRDFKPPSPSLADGFVGGTVTAPVGLHRYLAYQSLRKFFGYDLTVERLPLGYDFRITIRPLSITPERIELDNPSSWTTVPLSGYPTPQTVHSGATIALDLFVSPTTGQKIVDYIHVFEARPEWRGLRHRAR